MATDSALKASSFAVDLRSTPALWPVLTIMLGVPLVFIGTTASMARVWSSNETFTHGFLVLPISLWLIWMNRGRINTIQLAPDMRALYLLTPLLFGWLVVTAIDIAAVRQLALVALVPIVVWLCCGYAVLRLLLFPMLYLFFAVPLGQGLIAPMMEITADMCVALVQRSGVPVYRDGLSFELPTGSWSVVEECSGVRYLIASLALGTIYAYLTYRSPWRRSAFIVAATILPILANGLRAYGIVMIGHFSGMKYAVGADHLLYGWVFFGLVVFLLFWFGNLWRDNTTSEDLPVSSSPPATVPTNSLYAVGLVILALLLFSAGTAVVLRPNPLESVDNAALSLPSPADWKRESESATGWTPILHNPATTLTATYSYENSRIDLAVGWFPVQEPGAEVVSSLNRLTDPYGGEWKLVARTTTDVSATGPTVSEAELVREGQKVMVWQVFRVGTQLAADPYRGKAWEAYSALIAGRSDGAYITVATPWDAPPHMLRTRLRAFWAATIPELTRQLDARASTH